MSSASEQQAGAETTAAAQGEEAASPEPGQGTATTGNALPRPVYLQRIDRAQNMRRWYTLHAQLDLFGGIWVICRWGRIGQRGGAEQQLPCASVEQARERMRQLEKRRRQRGYRRKDRQRVASA